jgi:hypothetical protein
VFLMQQSGSTESIQRFDANHELRAIVLKDDSMSLTLDLVACSNSMLLRCYAWHAVLIHAGSILASRRSIEKQQPATSSDAEAF